MPVQRARDYHRGRVASTFGEEITAMLEGELSDPRIASCHVTEVILAPGGKSCRVLVAVHGDEDEEDSTLEGLMAARAYIRTEIRDRMGVRHVPEISFAIDRSEKIGARLDQVFENIEKRRKKIVRKAAKKAAPKGDSTPTSDPTPKAK
ncbi:ribosome-binding factor A [Bryocella elongata]|uniref:Ribosome-binding factor A n=1 Tax=Bryocella elongata TaxID=863522 RepID=A0A1H5WEW8_9BACT|nr:30S ribosome-binding factor RbfA [Bryocella elongata]SEF97910.1 ribosome-binding factor A [Bryocella elongata]